MWSTKKAQDNLWVFAPEPFNLNVIEEEQLWKSKFRDFLQNKWLQFFKKTKIHVKNRELFQIKRDKREMTTECNGVIPDRILDFKNKKATKNSLAIQWLGLCTLSHAVWPQNKKLQILLKQFGKFEYAIYYQ